MYYDDIFLQNGFIDMLCKISNQFVERLDVLSFDDVRPLLEMMQLASILHLRVVRVCECV